MVPVVALSSRREAAWMSELGLRDSQQIIKSEDVIPPSLRARTTQDLSRANCARVSLQDPTPSIPELRLR